MRTSRHFCHDVANCPNLGNGVRMQTESVTAVNKVVHIIYTRRSTGSERPTPR